MRKDSIANKKACSGTNSRAHQESHASLCLNIEDPCKVLQRTVKGKSLGSLAAMSSAIQNPDGRDQRSIHQMSDQSKA